MTPLLTGVFASQISGHLTPPYTLTGNYDALGTVTVPSGGLSSITFAGIPQTGYSHLQIRCIVRQTQAVANTYGKLRYNGDSSSSKYTLHDLYGSGSSAGAYGEGSGSINGSYLIAGASGTTGANVFGASVVDILDYTNTNKNKVGRGFTGFDNNGSGYVFLKSSTWLDTSAINSIQILQDSGDFTEYSQFALYGVKA